MLFLSVVFQQKYWLCLLLFWVLYIAGTLWVASLAEMR
jgi:hypothetical protein